MLPLVAGTQMHPEGLDFMGHARDHLKASDDRNEPRLQLVFPGDQLAVRRALREAMVFLRDLGIAQDACGPVELVLAEAINNIVEHAFDGQIRGSIELSIKQIDGDLNFTIFDDGRPMPGGDAPLGHPHNLSCDLIDLPEGGFGWFLIRNLTRELIYTRIGNRNQLQFTINPSSGNRPQ